MNRFVAFAIAVSMAAPALADDVFGTWKTQRGANGGHLKVEISSCGSKICGKIQKVVLSDDKSSEGKMIIENMTADGNGKYSGGTIWAPDTDKTYISKMSLNGDVLKVTGCVAVCTIVTRRSQNWKRID